MVGQILGGQEGQMVLVLFSQQLHQQAAVVVDATATMTLD
jgi:hypothetical protein